MVNVNLLTRKNQLSLSLQRPYLLTQQSNFFIIQSLVVEQQFIYLS